MARGGFYRELARAAAKDARASQPRRNEIAKRKAKAKAKKKRKK